MTKDIQDLKLQSTAKNTSTKGHNHSLSEVFDCPECSIVLEKMFHDREHKHDKEPEPQKEEVITVPCLDCGEKVDERAEKCPTCGSKYARG